MVAARYDLEIEQGADLHRHIVWKDPDGVLIDLTGARVLFQVRKNADSADTFLSFDSDNLLTGQTIGALDASGVIDFTIAGELTKLLDFTVGDWDLFVVTSGGEDDKILTGRATLKRAVTRWA